MNQANFMLVGESLPRLRSNPGQLYIEPTQAEIKDLFGYQITPETELPPMQPLFSFFDTPCFYRGELVADCGKAKSGKTTFLSLLMAGAVGRQPLMSLKRTQQEPLKVVWIDTEQSQQSTQEILRERILPLSGEKCDQLYAFNFRGLGYNVRRRKMEVALRTIQPDLAIIDGIKDLVTDINDATQATLIMEQLMGLARDVNCCMVCVLHLNKNEQDRNMRGSIGTELTNKAFEVYQCEIIEETGTFKVSQTLSRKRRMERTLYYRLDETGRPEEHPSYQEQPCGTGSGSTPPPFQPEDLKKLFADAMEGRGQRTYKQVMSIALNKLGVKDATTFYKATDAAVRMGIIRKGRPSGSAEDLIELVTASLFDAGAYEDARVF